MLCGDVDASSRGGEGGRVSHACARPDLLDRPFACPLGGDVLVVAVRLRRRRRIQLDEALDLESVRCVAARSSRRERDGTRPRACRATPPCPIRTAVARVARRHHPCSCRARTTVELRQEDEPPAGPDQPRRFRDPEVGISPERGAILREDKVERRVRKRDLLADRLDEREVEAGVLLQTARRRRTALVWDRPRRRARRDGPARRRSTRCRNRARRRPGPRRRRGRSASDFGLLEDAPRDLLLCPGLRGSASV